MTDLLPGRVAGRGKQKLSRAEQKKFTFCETTIAKGVALIEASFQTIRDERLYREQHSSFDAYCRHVWGLTRRTIDRRIKFALIVAEAETNRSQRPKNEWQSRQPTEPALTKRITSKTTGQAGVDPKIVQDGLLLKMVETEIGGEPRSKPPSGSTSLCSPSSRCAAGRRWRAWRPPPSLGCGGGGDRHVVVDGDHPSAAWPTVQP